VTGYAATPDDETEYVGVDNVKRGQFVGYIERQRVKMGFLFPSSKQERKKEK
jgi:hypothetical protein